MSYNIKKIFKNEFDKFYNSCEFFNDFIFIYMYCFNVEVNCLLILCDVLFIC